MAKKYRCSLPTLRERFILSYLINYNDCSRKWLFDFAFFATFSKFAIALRGRASVIHCGGISLFGVFAIPHSSSRKEIDRVAHFRIEVVSGKETCLFAAFLVKSEIRVEWAQRAYKRTTMGTMLATGIHRFPYDCKCHLYSQSFLACPVCCPLSSPPLAPPPPSTLS